MADQKSERGFASMDEDKQRDIASKGGQASGGNFKNDPERAAEAGHKGGQSSGGNFKNDPERAAGAGPKGRRKLSMLSRFENRNCAPACCGGAYVDRLLFIEVINGAVK